MPARKVSCWGWCPESSPTRSSRRSGPAGAGYWQQCHDSLRTVLPVFQGPDGPSRHAAECADEDCQALTFNARREYLFADKSARDSQLAIIFAAPVHPVVRVQGIQGHEGDPGLW